MQTLDVKAIQDWIVALSAAIALLSTAIAAWAGVLQYRLKVKAERRTQESSRAETDIRLSQLFTELVWVAHARSGTHVSEKCIEELFERGMITKDDFRDPQSLNERLATACVINLPVGMASQNAAIAFIAVLGSRYEILREPAGEALNSLMSFKKDEAERAMTFLKKGPGVNGR